MTKRNLNRACKFYFHEIQLIIIIPWRVHLYLIALLYIEYNSETRPSFVSTPDSHPLTSDNVQDPRLPRIGAGITPSVPAREICEY